MATLIKNASNTTPECGEVNLKEITERVTSGITLESLAIIRDEILQLDSAVAASADARIKNIKKATSFPIAEIQSILLSNPDCKYLRVYNGFNSNDKFVTYIAPISEAFEDFIGADINGSSVVLQSCCHCNPCTSDTILNP
jgi:hypothetical protein